MGCAGHAAISAGSVKTMWKYPTRRKVSLARLQPCTCCYALALGTVSVAAGVVSDPPMATVGASLEVTTKS